MEQVALIGARALVLATMLPAAGLSLYALASQGPGRPVPGARRIGAGLALLAALASIGWLLADVAAMAGMPVTELDRATVLEVAAATPLGAVLIVRLAALLLLAVAVLARWPTAIAALAGVVALATAAFTGHAGATEGVLGLLHRLADIAHLAAAAVWIGALGLFLVQAAIDPEHAALEQRLARFATLGSVLVGVLLLSGAINTALTAGLPPPIAAGWTRLLVLKLGLFALMLALAGLNRWRLVPRLRHGGAAARRTLRRSLACEWLAGLAILALVAQLGTLDPAG